MAKRELSEINAGSMADIAFLLLIFFLVTTTIDSDKGLQILLPPKIQENQPPPLKPKKRNVLNVLVNGRDQLLVRGELTKLEELTGLVKTHVDNFGVNPDFSEDPEKAIVSIKNDRGTSYSMYIKVQNEMKRAYNELRAEEAMQAFGKSYDDLTDSQKKIVNKKYPQKISEAEPENIMGGDD
jgi:biopolymer transport protein ExbD